MRAINHIRRTATLLLLLLGWAVGCPLTAQTELEVVVVPDPSTNLSVSYEFGETMPNVEKLTISDFGVYFDFNPKNTDESPRFWSKEYESPEDLIFTAYNHTITLHSDSSRIVKKIRIPLFSLEDMGFDSKGTLKANTGKISYNYDQSEITWENTENDTTAVFTVTSDLLFFHEMVLTISSSIPIAVLPKTPALSQRSFDFYEPFELTITDLTTPSATIRYTLDGSEPTATNGTVYTAPITIPIGKDVTVKAVAVNENGVSGVAEATYHFVSHHKVKITVNNPNAIRDLQYEAESKYGYFGKDGTVAIKDGEDVYIYWSINSDYKVKNVTIDGETVGNDNDNTWFSFEMPASDVDVQITCQYDPSSPSDPEPGEQSKTYTLTLVSNPANVGCELYSAGEYVSGSKVDIGYYIYNSDYVFTGWSKNGQTISTANYLEYEMPAEDVVLTCNLAYKPSSPSEPQQPALLHPLTAIASPSGSATFYTTGSTVKFGESYDVYCYPQEGYVFKGWILNGVAQETKSTSFNGVMTDAGAHLVALCEYKPSSPANPNANYYNSTTGQAIIDDFTSGYMGSALRTVMGNSEYDNVSSLIVKGRMQASDYGFLHNLKNAQIIDLSRVGGETTVPSSTFQNMSVSSVALSAATTQLGSYVFQNCQNLSSITVYAMEPPTCGSYTFNGFTNKDNCTIFVPKEAIDLYTKADYWKDFAIMPISDDVHVLQVNLPADGANGKYKHNSLEIVNLSSGVRQKYVVADRMLYTFNGLQKDEQYNVYMCSQSGLEIGRIENVTIPDHDIEVTFSNLKMLYDVKAQVLATDGSDVTQQATVEWLRPLDDGSLAYLRKAAALGEIPDGQKLVCRVTLGEKLGRIYANPTDVEITVGNEQNICSITLVPFRKVELTGTVADGDGVALSDASVSLSQTLNGKFEAHYAAKTDRCGKWKATVIQAPETRITYAATECVSVNDTIPAFADDVTTADMGKVMLKSIVGARINYNFTYQAAGAETAENYYTDYQNVTFKVYNVTQGREHKELSVQYPVLAVLDDNIATDDQLRITAISKNGAFNDIEQTVTIGETQRAEATFAIVGKGGIAASFGMTDNPAVTAMLYSVQGELLKKKNYAEASATFEELEDGTYTLVSMGQSDLMNAILRLSNFDEIGLSEGKDYVKTQVNVESGKMTQVEIAEIPAFDESLFYYTNASTNFSANKSSITTGGYLTLRAAVDFKGVYRNDVRNVALVVDLPEACDFVEKSVIQGPNLLPYTIDNNRLTIQLGNNYQTQTRFCVIPTTGGSFQATASITFEYDGRTITQPIGSANSEIRNLAINVPSVVASAQFKVTGTALAGSEVKIMENGNVLGTAKANSAGSWNAECELVAPYNLSEHAISAAITTKNGNTLVSETKKITYDMNAVQVAKVVMYHYNPEMRKTYESEFDFLNPKTSPTQWTVYYPNKKFTYTIEFTDNDPERISHVVLYVHTADGRFVPCKAEFDAQKKLWYAEVDMGHSSDGYYPVNCSVDFDYISKKVIDSAELTHLNQDFSDMANQITEDVLGFDNSVNHAETSVDSEIDNIENSDVQDWASTLDNLIEDVAGKDLEEEVSDNSYSHFNSMSDEELNTYIGNLGKIDYEGETADMENAADSLLAKLSFDIGEGITLEDGTKITVKTCEGLTPDSLIEKGFQLFQTIDGNGVYVLNSEYGSEVADFTNNRYSTIVYGQNLQTMAKALLKQKSNVETGLDTFNDIIEKINSYYQPIADAWEKTNKKIINFVEYFKNEYTKISFDFGRKKAIYNAKANKLNRLKRELANLNSLSLDYHLKLGEIKEYQKEVKAAKKLMQSSGRMKALTGAAFKAVKPLPKIFIKEIPLVNYADAVYTYTSIARKYQKVYLTIPNPCKDDQAKSDGLRRKCIDNAVKTEGAAALKLGANALADFATIAAVTSLVQTGGTAIIGAVAVVIGKVAAFAYVDLVFDSMVQKNINRIEAERDKLQCLKECGKPGNPPCPGGGGNGGGNGGNGGGNGGNGGGSGSGCADDNVQIDPSGFVYEAVPTNRVEGVQASIYYKETVYDMYGDPHEDIVLWNAEEYAQKNPLFTDENGMYRWDVPQGMWQVKFEKDGYVTAYSDWLPVPPPQLDVNVGITQNKQPEVIEARAYEEGVEMQFDKFMDLSTLTTSNIFVTANGTKLEGEVQFVNATLADEFAEASDPDAMRYASRVRFVPVAPLSVTTGEIRLTVSRNVKSYAGIPMTETFSQVLDVEKEVQSITADDVKVLYGEEKTLTVYATPFEAAVGRTLHIANSSDLIASLDNTEALIDAEGKATVKIKGDLPGNTQLTFTIDDVTVSGQCAVDVVTEIITAEAPRSSRASGTAVYRGTKVELTTDSKNATIYFTTDGSCPCDENGTRRKYTVPIIINGDTKILAMTSVGNGDEDVSSTVEFNYTLKRSDMDFQMAEGWTWMSHNFESEIAPSVLATEVGISRILSQTQEVVRDPQLGMVGTLTSLKASESYKVETSAATTLPRLSDYAWNPATPIALFEGWNWLGYPMGQTMTVDEALATTDAETNDVIVGQQGFAQFDGEHWVGTLETMSPGMGYMYQSQTAKDVVYNTGIVSKAASKAAKGISSTLPLALDIHKYASIMPMVATLTTTDGTPLDNNGFEVAAFCGTECRGISRVVNGLVMMNIYGNVNDNITFHITDKDGTSDYGNGSTLRFSERVVGSLSSPHVLTVSQPTGISENAYSGKIKVTVSNGVLKVNGLEADDICNITIFNAEGKKVMHDTHVTDAGISISVLTSGTYVVVVDANGEFTYHKIAVR